MKCLWLSFRPSLIAWRWAIRQAISWAWCCRFPWNQDGRWVSGKFAGETPSIRVFVRFIDWRYLFMNVPRDEELFILIQYRAGKSCSAIFVLTDASVGPVLNSIIITTLRYITFLGRSVAQYITQSILPISHFLWNHSEITEPTSANYSPLRQLLEIEQVPAIPFPSWIQLRFLVDA